ncbi:trp operon leader peptide [Streptomyces sp. NPDC050161]
MYAPRTTTRNWWWTAHPAAR